MTLSSVVRATVLMSLAFVLAGCFCCRNTGKPKTVDGIQRGPVPQYGVVAAAYNARVAHLERLAATLSSAKVEGRQGEDKRFSEQVESNLQIAQPDRVAMTFTKYSQMLFVLGSNSTNYWWFDLTNEPTAIIGSHSKVTPQTVASLGIPVHPLDLIEVLGILPLPEPGSPGAGEAKLEWSPDGRLLGLTLPGRWGDRRFWLEPDSYDPSRIELLDAGGKPQVSCLLTRYSTVEVNGDTTVHPRMAERFAIDLPTQGAKALLTFEPLARSNNTVKMKMQQFDLPFLLKHYEIKRIIDVDAPAAAGKAP